MSSYRQILLQIVFRTKSGRKTLKQDYNSKLFNYIWGIVKEKGCFLYQINGMEDHLHLLTDLSPTITMADYIRDIKTSTSIWAKKSGYFPNFSGWASGYGAFSYSFKEKERLINYVKNQQVHHAKFSFEDEYRRLLKEHNIPIDERYFLK